MQNPLTQRQHTQAMQELYDIGMRVLLLDQYWNSLLIEEA